MSDMSERLRKARKMAGYRTMAAFTEAHGLHYPTYAGHENGHREFSHEAARYASLLRVSLQWLMTSKGSPKTKDQTHHIVELFESIPPERQPEAIDFLEYLRAKRPDQRK